MGLKTLAIPEANGLEWNVRGKFDGDREEKGLGSNGGCGTEKGFKVSALSAQSIPESLILRRKLSQFVSI